MIKNSLFALLAIISIPLLYYKFDTKATNLTVLIDKKVLSKIQKDALKELKIIPLFIPKSQKLIAKFNKDNSKKLNSRMILTNNENCLAFIHNKDLKKIIRICKDKFLFRKMLKNKYPNFFYKLIKSSELEKVDYENLPYPLIIKPVSGYGSTGVYRIQNSAEWLSIRFKLENDKKTRNSILSSCVLDTSYYLIEEALDGEEIAIDAYYDNEGNPVILNIMKRMFKDLYDTSDRVYYTSTQIVKNKYIEIAELLRQLGKELDLKSFPIHIEVRRRIKSGELVPIEINPMRFAGEGVCDISLFAFGINNFEHYIRQTSPDWDSIFAQGDNYIYGLFCADIPKEITYSAIDSINESKVKSIFSNIIDYRKTLNPDNIYFATVFYKSKDLEESKKLLRLNLNNFVNLKSKKGN